MTLSKEELSSLIKECLEEKLEELGEHSNLRDIYLQRYFEEANDFNTNPGTSQSAASKKQSNNNKKSSSDQPKERVK